jgi:hypothetical protein
VRAAPQGDFLLNEQTTIEVGGAKKDFRQISRIPQSFLALDDIEYASPRRIPLWLFGFLR